jgi:hypothetical protein
MGLLRIFADLVVIYGDASQIGGVRGHFVVRDRIISEILILSAIFSIYQRNSDFISEISNISANDSSQEVAPSGNCCLSLPRYWSRNPFIGEIMIISAKFSI